jgi:hypothetical protein
MDNRDWITLAAFWIAVASVLISFVGAMISYYLFRSSIDPHVIVYATADEGRPSIINLVIENIGKGLAKSVSFEFSRPIPEKAFGFADAKLPNRMQSGPLINGIPALGPGAKRVITWGQFGGLYKGLGDDAIEIRVRFRGDPAGIFAAKEHEVLCPIDIKSFEGTDASDRNWAKQSASQLERIADALGHAATGFRPIKVELIEPTVQQDETE